VSASVAARLDRLPVAPLHRRIAIIVGLGAFFDLFDIFLGGVLAAVLADPWHLSTNGKALVISSGFAGMFVGAAVFGVCADRFGRRRMFLVNLFVYSVFMLLAAAAPNLGWLAVLRFLGGLGLGAELTLADTYLSELLPARVRGRYIARAYTFGFIGVPLAAFVGGRFVAGHELLIDGWRWLLIAGGIGGGIVWILRRGLPESPRWQAIHGDAAEAERNVAAIEAQVMRQLELTKLPEPARGREPARPAGRATLTEAFSGEYARRSAMLWIFHILQSVGYYGFGSLAPLVLASKGFDIVATLGYSAVIFLGYPLGSAASIGIVERCERRTLIILSALAMAALGVVFGFAEAPWLILLSGFLLTGASNVFSNAYHIYQAEIFPTRVRATAIGSAYSLSRLSAAILPFVSVAILDGVGATAVFLGCAGILVLLCLDVGLLGPPSTGRTLEAASTASSPATYAAAPAASPAPRAGNGRAGTRTSVHSPGHRRAASRANGRPPRRRSDA
jgi:putative MFS transporter